MVELYDSIKDFLPPVFNLDPGGEKAFSISCEKPRLQIEIKNRYLNAYTEDKYLPDFKIDLRCKTIQAVVDEIGSKAGYATASINYAAKSALRLFKPDNDETGYVYVIDNPLVALMKAFAFELEDAKATEEELLRYMSVYGAANKFQDHWGGFFGIVREPNEADIHYGQRIAIEVKVPKTNNKSIEMILKDTTGLETEVIDLGWDTPGGLLYLNNDGTFVNDKDYHIWNTGVFASEGISFGVILKNKTIDDLTQEQFDTLIEVVIAIKQAGTRAKLLWKSSDCTGYVPHAGGMCGFYF